MKKIGFIFPGQGSQCKGMSNEWYKDTPIGQDILKRASAILGYDLSKICFYGDEDKIKTTEISQPLIYVVDYILYKLIEERYHILPSVMAGHSLGEYTALACSEVISFEDGLKLVSARSKIMNIVCESCDSGMLAVQNVNISDLMSILAQHPMIDISCDNDDNQIVVAGLKNDIDSLKEIFDENGIKYVVLKTAGAFHSRIFKEVASLFQKEIAQFKFHMPKNKLISNYSAKEISDLSEIGDNLTKQLYNTVRWRESVFEIEKQADYIIEIATKKTLVNTVHKVPCYFYLDGIKMLEKISGYQVFPEEEILRFAIRECVCTKSHCDAINNHKMKELYEKLLNEIKQITSINRKNQDVYLEGIAQKVNEIYELKGLSKHEIEIRKFFAAKEQLSTRNFSILESCLK